MTIRENDYFESLKSILKNIRNPELLDDHPWTHSLFAGEAASRHTHPVETSPGQLLVYALADIFATMQPAVPPRRGKRLDPRWGEFGLLAAFYFTPFNHGTPYPATLMEAWGYIDPAILYFVFGKQSQELEQGDIDRYQLVGSDLEFGAASTLSDWHRKGVERLADIILNRERYLARTLPAHSVILDPDQSVPVSRSSVRQLTFPPRIRRLLLWGGFLILILVLSLGWVKGQRIYASGKLVYQDLVAIRDLKTSPFEPQSLESFLPVLVSLQEHLSTFERDAQGLFWLAPKLKWVPVYGSDIAASPELLELAEHLVDASHLTAQATGPIMQEVKSGVSTLDPAGLTAQLVQAQPQLEEARKELDQGLLVREKITTEGLSPALQVLFAEELDPVLKLADDGLSLATALPGILGAGRDGPKTYLLLVQNEDELRPTGGFITSVGNLVIYQGRVIDLEFDEVGKQEDWTKPYPSAPWQLQEYMNSPVLVLRDSNWYADFPTAAAWAEYLYAYTHDHSFDGVIAFDQHFLVMLLTELGPLDVEGAPYPLTNGNVVEYMRAAKVPPEGEPISADWYRKEFISRIADALLKELTDGDTHDWTTLAGILFQALEERHLLLQFDDPLVHAYISKRGWDNAVHTNGEDFILVTDTNIGFNKTNAVVDVKLSYDVDLTDVHAPVGTLLVTHKNNARGDVPCIHWNINKIGGEEYYPINRCYWNYLRVYKQSGVELLDATPHAIPGEWMLLGRGVPARVDVLEEDLDNVQGFGTLIVVPGGESLSTRFRFDLSGAGLSTLEDGHRLIYRLKVQKQPGTLAIPLAVRIHLPNNANLISTSLDSIMQGQNLLIETDLLTDQEITLIFTIP